MMKYDINKLPDFFSVRNFEQIDYSLEGMEDKKCYCFFDNGFTSNIIEPNKRDIRFIWDGFVLFTEKNISIEDLRNGIDLYNARLVAFQRLGQFPISLNIRDYVIKKLKEKYIPYEIMKDQKSVSGYPAKSDLWSTRDLSVLIDAIDCVESKGEAYCFYNSNFKFEINFNESKIPKFSYSHKGAIVLRGENNIAISRFINNNSKLQQYIENLIGNETLYSSLSGKYLPGTLIESLESRLKK